MKCKIIRSYSSDDMENKLNAMYNTYTVKNVQTHIQSLSDRGRLTTMFIAYVFYLEKHVTEGGTPVRDLPFSNRVIYALYRANINTLEELQQQMALGNIKRIRNLGPISYEEIERVLSLIDK